MAFKFFTATALVLAASAAPAFAEPSPSSAPAPTIKAAPVDQTTVVCRRIESIGTRLGSKRVCRTKGDWDAEQAANRLDLERSQTQRQGKDS